MFKKKPSLKPAATIKSSERRKLYDAICRQFGMPAELDPTLKLRLLPKEVKVQRVMLGNGDLCKLYTGDRGRPLWVQTRDDVMVPTLLVLWDWPGLCPVLYTPEPTIERLQNGADLMIPGVFSPFPERAPKGSVLAVATLQNPSVPLAVGIALVDCASLQHQQGKALQIVSVINDELMGLYGFVKPPNELPAGPPAEVTVAVLPAAASDHVAEPSAEARRPEVVVDRLTIEDPNDMTEENYEIDSEEVDGFFTRALLQTLRLALDTPIDLPIPASSLMSNHILANLPVQDPSVQIKRTSWKKTQKFLSAMEKQGLVKCRDRAGELVVYWLSEADNVRNFTVFKPQKRQDRAASSGIANNKIVTREYLRPKSSTQALFEALPGLAHPVSAIVDTIKSYAIANKIVRNRTEIVPDDLLSQALKMDGPVQFANLRDLVLASRQFDKHYKIILPGDDEAKIKFTKGAIPLVKILVERRGGNKVVTIVSGLEPYQIEARIFSEELRVACAGSSTVSEDASGSKEILVQGNHEKTIRQLLEAKGLRPELVQVVDKSKGKKK